MAKALSQVYTIIRGSVGGLTYLSGRNNAIVVRARTAPVQPNTNAQVQMRNAWAAAEAQWRLATELQLNGWDNYARGVEYQGPMGSYNITGRQRALATLALASYLNSRFAETITISPAPPVKAGWFLTSGYALVAPSAPGIGFAINLTNDDPVPCVVLVNVSRIVPGTRNFWKGPWDDAETQVFNILGSSSGTHDVVGLVKDEKYFVRVRPIGDVADHRIGEPWILSGIAQETVV